MKITELLHFLNVNHHAKFEIDRTILTCLNNKKVTMNSKHHNKETKISLKTFKICFIIPLKKLVINKTRFPHARESGLYV